METGRVSELGTILRPIHRQVTRPDLSRLADVDLLESLRSPRDGNHVRVKPDGRITEGNGRAGEMMRRASNPASSITFDMEFPY